MQKYRYKQFNFFFLQAKAPVRRQFAKWQTAGRTTKTVRYRVTCLRFYANARNLTVQFHNFDS